MQEKGAGGYLNEQTKPETVNNPAVVYILTDWSIGWALCHVLSGQL